ncbi:MULTISPECIES: hypothetical protein [Sphingomonas]|uniref:Uncharacterized protein n=1 Tax=Edaphosphingomonas fennica TaxID=114404 RepID=A0A2T4I6Z7_9SPHN|nr:MULTISPECIES: hypothetical protein [Sphingomonas]AGH50890.1 hypothetical protein G432_15860 [Sphingomonas sp. MM-1]MDX3886332.1 hypothetical protein [Sphingomonas sp.]PTD26472.1 hypothetical protein CV103_03160 [Sphingomonas fennica]
MQTIELDGSRWSERLDFWFALRAALGVLPEHGTGFDAFEDSVFYHPEMLSVRPPFTVVVHNAPPIARSDIEQMAEGWAFQRKWKRENYGDDVEALIVAVL